MLTTRPQVLDENGKPNIGPFDGRGFMTIDSRTKEITRSGNYWAMKHYTHGARRGARRFDSQANEHDLVFLCQTHAGMRPSWSVSASF